MSLVNELLDDLQQQQRKQAGPLDIPALSNAPKKTSKLPRVLIWSMSAAAVIAGLATIAQYLDTEKRTAPETKSVALELKPIELKVVEQSQVVALPEMVVDVSASSKPLTLNSQVYSDKNKVVLWLQSPELLDLGSLKLSDQRQQLLIKHLVDIDLESDAMAEFGWLKIQSKTLVEQTWLSFIAEFPIELKLEPVREKLGWFNYELIIEADETLWAQRFDAKPQLEPKIANTTVNASAERQAQITLRSDDISSVKTPQIIDKQVLNEAKKLLREGQSQAAEVLVSQALSDFDAQTSQSDLVHSRQWLLQQLLQQQRWQQFDQVLHEGELRQGSDKALVKLAARAKLKRQDYETAWQLLSQLPLSPKADAEHVQLFANLAYRMQRFAKAKQLYQSLVSQYPQQPIYAVGLARSLEALEQPQQALPVYEFAFQQGLQQESVKKFVVKRIVQLKQVENRENL